MAKKITKVTTKTGDDGSTGMGDGSRVSKGNIIIQVIGELDELNSWLGLISSYKELKEYKGFLQNIQSLIFVISADLTTKSKTSFDKKHIERLEIETNKLNDSLPLLENFILPGGSKESSCIHIARTVCRRVERSLVRVSESEKIDSYLLIFINRLSDFLFTLARRINLDLGEEEFLWKKV
tara:strand:- start:3050 stop:3592 length:543 start_codon:yes stop_codon:yes gene_type:complete